MTSFIVVSKDTEKGLEYARNYCAEQKIDQFDITIITKDTNTKTTSIGIDDVKQMQKKVYLKPLRSKTKAVILDGAQLLTTEAQNALLKVLEEPPVQTIILLLTDTKDALLPTIISRCKVIEIEQAQTNLTPEETAELKQFVEALPSMSVGEKLKKAEQLAKDKDASIAWIEKMILFLRGKLLEQKEDTAQQEYEFMRQLQKLHTTLKNTNVNARFAIEIVLLRTTN